VAEGCQEAGCALVGGETAEMPGFYSEGEYDLAGFAVGLVDRQKMITGSCIEPGDVLIGLASSGIHSNGFSLVRRLLLEERQLSLEEVLPGFDQPLGNVLLTPTRIYVKPVLAVLDKYQVKGMAHITGGGFSENIPRMLPDGCEALIYLKNWQVPAIFNLLAEVGELDNDDLYATFNMGIGLVMAVTSGDAGGIVEILNTMGEKAMVIGLVAAGEKKVTLCTP
jgi:phosphoribosylformylglycinamidine cyclo-ligase